MEGESVAFEMGGLRENGLRAYIISFVGPEWVTPCNTVIFKINNF